jgi:hypothetical protein
MVCDFIGGGWCDIVSGGWCVILSVAAGVWTNIAWKL